MTTNRHKVNWLDRRIAAPGPYLCLCLYEPEYHAAMAHLNCPASSWIKSPQAHATAHHVESPKGLACVVCLNEWQGRDPIEVAGLLVHESVHIWQEYCSYYGEASPGHEQEAYAIQSISQELMAEFSRRMATTPKGKVR